MGGGGGSPINKALGGVGLGGSNPTSGGLFGGVGSFLYGDGGAEAAGQMAMAQQAEAQRQFNAIKGITDQATVSGIASFEQDLKNQEKNISRQEQMISQIDPTILEASQQALKLLRGEQSSTLQPIQNQRSLQRQKLLNSLREQLGPGAETSTAGIQALTRFDAETNNLLSGQQQSALALLGNVGGQWNAVRPDMSREYALRSQYGQGKSNLLFNQAQILSGQGKSLIDTAGAQYTGDFLRGQQNAAFGKSIINGVISGATGQGMSGGQKPPAAAAV